MSYQDLDRRSNQAARFLLDHGIGQSDRVCINLDKDATPYCVILACLKLGIGYFAIDPSSPLKRTEKIFAQCSPALIFSHTELASPQWKDKTIVCPASHDNLAFCSDYPTAAPERQAVVHPENTAYIMFTSGSTGVPKGAVMSHGNLDLFIDWAVSEYGFTPEDTHTHLNPIYFDNSVFDIYSTLFSGGTLVPFKTAWLQEPQKIVDHIEKTRCTTFFSVPSMLMFLQTTKVIEPQALRSLRWVIFGGEGYPKTRLKELYDQLSPQTKLVNVYGPTECTCICSSYQIGPEDFENLEGYPPIGSLTRNFHYRLLAGSEEVPPGESGELCLGGPCVGQGYLGQTELTKKAFVPDPRSPHEGELLYRTGDLFRLDPSDQKLWFVGRKDFQIKHQGHRIELEEIEHALMSLEGIDEAVALHSIDGEISRIIAVIASRKDFTGAEIKRRVADWVPKYMVPNRVYLLKNMPKNANGKTDRKFLRSEFVKNQQQRAAQ